MILQTSPKIFQNYKCEFPEKTVDKIKKNFRKIGLFFKYKEYIVKSAEKSTYSGNLSEQNIGFMTHGKGVSSILAKASAYAEMVERFSTAFFVFRAIEDSEKYGSYISKILDRQFLKGYEKTNKKPTISDVNKEFFIEKISKEEYDLLNEQELFNSLVNSYSLINGTTSKVPVKFFDTMSGSTGLASGNTYEEAISEASCEIFERYAASTVVTKKLECPTIDISTIDYEIVQEYMKMFDEMNIEIVVKDFTFGNKIPVIGILIINKNIEKDKNTFKKSRKYMRIHAGSHIDLRIALLRCFTECFQGLSKQEFMYGKKLDKLYKFWTKELHKDYTQKKDNFKYFFKMYDYYGDLSFMKKGKIIDFKKLHSCNNDDAFDDCKNIIESCKKNKWDISIIDYTHPILDFPTVRVIIPPISTDSDPFLKNFLKIIDYKTRYNYYYGIKNFYDYVKNDNWINNNKEIQKLINNIENHLSKELTSYQFFLMRGAFNQYVNLFHILAFSYLAVKNYKESLKYMNFLKELDNKIDYLSVFHNVLLNTSYNPSLYSSYIHLLKRELKEPGTIKDFKFKQNPFQPIDKLFDSSHLIETLLTNINDSFFIKK